MLSCLRNPFLLIGLVNKRYNTSLIPLPNYPCLIYYSTFSEMIDRMKTREKELLLNPGLEDKSNSMHDRNSRFHRDDITIG